jgi:prepilin-type N-terminal cleavage/methylation domain-containing protein
MNKGFTIIELIISIFILAVSTVGVYSAFSIMNILTADAADRLTATYLAQEGMEIVRNIRDTNWLNAGAGATWLDGLSACANGCEADYTTGTTAQFPYPMTNTTGDFLYINSNGFYNYATSGTKTRFQRKIIVAPIPDAKGDSSYIVKVTVQVSWSKKATVLSDAIPAGATDLLDPTKCNSSNCITAEGALYNWYPQ